jgi:predicted amidohydrolase YtcJ
LVDTDQLRELVRRARAGGIGAAVHAIGDRANARALDVFADLGGGGRIEHAQLLGESDIARFARLGVTASVQPAHLLDDQASAEAAWPGRATQTFPLASLHHAGARLVFGSDAPVAPLDPWGALAAAVARARPGFPAWTPEQRLPVEVALACSMRGPLRPGAGDLADLVLLDADPLRVPVEDLATLPVAATLLAGRLTHLAM